MRIPLDHSIWTRLYGAYGLDDVSDTLGDLHERWNEALAADLFWERLHHQDSLYPVTYAALPWIWDALGTPSRKPEAAFDFLSHAIHCAVQPPAPPGGRFHGLSPRIEDHRPRWISERDRLTEADMAVLGELENWFAKTAPVIARECLEGVGVGNAREAALRAAGSLAWEGGFGAAWAVDLWSEGGDVDTVRRNMPPAGRDAEAVATILPSVEGRNEALFRFLTEYVSRISA